MKYIKQSLIIVLLIISTTFFTFSCERGKDRKAKNYNVIIISIDALRPDHMSDYGYSRQTTPNIDAFFKKCTLFKHAVTVYPKTASSMTSMLTGLYPYHHGVRKNAKDKLRKTIRTLPEILKGYGYSTAAFISNVVLKSKLSGLNQGFDVYDERLQEKELNRNLRERTAANLIKPAIRWIKENKEKKFFLWIHFIDPHGPYTPPKPYNKKFRSKEKKLIDINLISSYQRRGNLNDANRYIDYYDGEIAFMDENVGKLLRIINKEVTKRKSLIIFTADHGESLGEHNDYFEHGRRVYDTCLRIPLAIHLDDVIPENKINDTDQVAIIDIMPTILDILDIEPRTRMDGKTLLPLITKNEKLNREYVFPEVLNQYKPKTVPKNVDSFKAIRSRDWKYVLAFDKNGKILSEELYNIANDYSEENNLASKEIDIKNKLKKKLLQELERQKKNIFEKIIDWIETKESKKKRETEINKKDLEALKSLGYVK
ncbi:MAG: hypothetical protein D6734_03130 [Candidatus Schekmanbacteria bacterium]|nr:MAG: hypothetical protein D6734_03130 [Candidatus Schekmanbacteria bacterium]